MSPHPVRFPIARARGAFIDRVGTPPAVVAFVLPMAIERGVAVALMPRRDRRLRAHAVELDATVEIALDGLEPGRVYDWVAYVAGVVWALEQAWAPIRLPGFDVVVASDLPIAAGLSSSAALEVATARAVSRAGEQGWDPLPMALLCQRVENEFVGVPCGVMDQIAVALPPQGCAILLDCRSLETTLVPVPPTAVVVVMDSGVRRALAHSAYAERRAACARAVSTLQASNPNVRALRDVDEPMLEAARATLDPMAFRRASHVVAEIRRPAALARALAADDLAAAGELMNDSHASLRDLYEVSCAELDLLCDLARAHPACFGARLTGAGFGGCAIALVGREGAEDFKQSVGAAYRARAPGGEPFFVTRPEAGARAVD
jgi:galactokinase